MQRAKLAALGACALAASFVLGTAPVQAAGSQTAPSRLAAGTPVAVAEGLDVRSLALGPQGSFFAAGRDFTPVEDGSLRADGFIDRISRDGTRRQLLRTPGEETAALSLGGSALFFTQNAQQAEDVAAPRENSAAVLKSLDRQGQVHTVADLAAYERTHNPDAAVTYGYQVDAQCLAQFGTGVPEGDLPASYTGLNFSLPSATVPVMNSVYVADAGANTILRVDDAGTVSTVAVLPPSQLTLTAQFVADHDLPTCAVGHQLYNEPRPTDMELGADGWLYVTTQPQVSASLGGDGRGSVYKVNPQTGETDQVATGLTYPEGLAVQKDTGRIFVSELFSDRISVIEPGSTRPVPFVSVPSPRALEIGGDALYAGSGTQLLRIPLTAGAKS